MSAVLILNGGSHVKVTEDFDSVVHDLKHAEERFHYFDSDGTFPDDPRVAVRVDAVVAVVDA